MKKNINIKNTIIKIKDFTKSKLEVKKYRIVGYIICLAILSAIIITVFSINGISKVSAKKDINISKNNSSNNSNIKTLNPNLDIDSSTIPNTASTKAPIDDSVPYQWNINTPFPEATLESTPIPTAIPTVAPVRTFAPTSNPTKRPSTTAVPKVNYASLPEIVKKQDYDQATIDNYLSSSIVDTTSKIYDYEEMLEDIQIIYSLFSDKIKVNNLGTTADGRSLVEIIVGNVNASNHILLHGSIHGREYMTSQLLMNQLEYYLKNYESGTYKDISFEQLFNNVAVHIVPMVNPDGVTISQFGTSKINSQSIINNLNSYYKRDYAAHKIYTDFNGYLEIWKSNAIGTDINKNFDNDWDSYDGPVAPARLNYKGTAPESEPETQALVSIVNNYNIVGSIAYHTAGSVIYWDYGQKGVIRTKSYELASAIRDLTNYKIYDESDIKLNPAGYSDWMVKVKNIPSITVEVGSGTAPIPISEFSNVWSSNKYSWAKMCYMYSNY